MIAADRDLKPDNVELLVPDDQAEDFDQVVLAWLDALLDEPEDDQP